MADKQAIGRSITLEQAVEILNKRAHRGVSTWAVRVGQVSAGHEDVLTALEARAVAEKYLDIEYAERQPKAKCVCGNCTWPRAECAE